MIVFYTNEINDIMLNLITYRAILSSFNQSLLKYEP